MVAPAVDEHAKVLRERVFLSRPRAQIPETAMDKDDGRAAVAAQSVRQARAVDVGDVGRWGRGRDWSRDWCSARGCRVLGRRISATGCKERATDEDSHGLQDGRRHAETPLAEQPRPRRSHLLLRSPSLLSLTKRRNFAFCDIQGAVEFFAEELVHLALEHNANS